MQLFRRLLLLRLHKAERLSESFMQNLLTWVHPGFSVYSWPPVNAAEIVSIEAQARYITRPVLGMDALRTLDDGSLVAETPPNPRTGATSIELDPREWIHRITSHIPDPERHCQRFYGAYSNRGRISKPDPDDETATRCTFSCFLADSSRFSLVSQDRNAYKDATERKWTSLAGPVKNNAGARCDAAAGRK
jgi:hypothetical protein